LEHEWLSLHHRARVKSAFSTFARWLVEEKGLLQKNPTRGIDLPAIQMLAPRQLSEDQRFILRSPVEQEGDRRGAALFALGRLRRLPGERRLLAGKGSYAYRPEGWLATRGS